MDLYERLFDEKRPIKNRNLKSLNLNELKSKLDSDLLKYLEQSMKYLKKYDYENAIKYINKAIKIDIKNSHLYEVRANIKEESGNFKDAIDDYKYSLYISGEDNYAIYNQIAVNYYNLNELTKAINAFDIAIELKHNIEYDETILPYYNNGVVIRENIEVMYTNRASVYLKLEDFNECKRDCNRAIENNPEYPNSYLIYGLMFLAIDESNNAFTLLKIAESKGHQQATFILNQYF